MSKEQEFIDIAAERAVNSGILRYGYDAYIDVADLLDASVLQDSFNAQIFRCAEHYYSNGNRGKLDLPSLMSAAKVLGYAEAFQQPEEIRHLRALTNFPIEPDTVRKEAAKLVKLRVAQALDEIAAQSRRDLRKVTGLESLDTIVGILENPIFDYVTKINRFSNTQPIQIAHGIDEYLDHLEANPRDNIGISSGYAKYDWAIGGGFRRATVSMVGARMKIGKTVWCDNVSLHVAGTLKIPVLNLDTEMTQEEHLARVLAHLSGVTIREIESGKFAQDAAKRRLVRDAAAWLKDIPYYYDSVIDKSFEEHMAIIRRWTTKEVGVTPEGNTKDCLVVYDYFQTLDSNDISGHVQEHQVLGFQMVSMLRMAARCDIPILSMVQLNRDGIEKDTTGVIAGSDRIARKVANFSILKRKDEEELAEFGEEEGTHKLIPLICRHGEGLSFGDYINMKFEGQTAKIIEGKTRNELVKSGKARDFEVEVSESDENVPEKKRKISGRRKKNEPHTEVDFH